MDSRKKGIEMPTMVSKEINETSDTLTNIIQQRFNKPNKLATLGVVGLLAGVQLVDLARASAHRQPPKGALVNTEVFADGIPVFDNRDVVDCQSRTRGLNQHSSFGNVYSPGIVYRQRVSKKIGSSVIKLKLGLADMQQMGGYLGDTGINGSYLFRNSCESVVTDTNISVQLVKRAKNKKGFKVITQSLSNSKTHKSIRLKKPGFKSTAYINELLGANGRRAGLNDGRLEWKNPLKFKLPHKLTKQDLKSRLIGFRVKRTVKPLVEVPLEDLNDVGMSKYDRSIYPKKVTTKTYTTTKWVN